MTRVLIVSDVRFYRDCLSQALQDWPHLRVVGAVPHGEAAARSAKVQRPDVALLDLTLREGLGAVKAFRSAAPDPRVVLLAVPELEEEILACAEAGVAGYVPGSRSRISLSPSSVGRGEVICSARVAGALMRRVAALASERRGLPGHEPLTSRELDVAALLEAGFSNKEIAGRLCIEVTTVKHHVHNILEKLCVSRRGEAAVKLRDAAGQRLPQISIKS